MASYTNETVTFEIIENLVVFGERRDCGWTKEANIIRWNDGVPKIDIREWNPTHERMSRGITLMETEAEALAKVLSKRYATR